MATIPSAEKIGNTDARQLAFFTVINATSPACVSKYFTLIEDRLTSQTSASITCGRMHRVGVSDAQEFAAVLSGLGTDQCLVYGVPPRDADLVTERRWFELGRPDDALPRSKDVMHWPQGGGVLMLDYDAPKDDTEPLGKDALIDALVQACPLAQVHDLIWWPSTSSLIFTTGGKELRGIRGQRLYLIAQDASDIPRAGKALNDRLWALGHGRCEVSASGSILERGTFDGSVWQTNRIDFAAGAACGVGLEQRRGVPVVVEGILGAAIDTRQAIPDLTPAEQTAATTHKAAARAAVSTLARTARDAWVDARADDMIRRNPRMERSEARAKAERTAERRELMGDWLVTVRDADGKRLEVSVLAVLDNPAKYHGLKCLDPLEPGYDGGRWVGKLYLYGARPVLYSMAHGGVTFRLSRQPQLIELVRGKSSETADALVGVLRRSPDFFDFGAELVVVGRGGSVHPLNEHGLRYEAGKATQFWYWGDAKKKTEVEPADPPAAICRAVLALGTRRELKALDAVITAPTLRPDGSVLAKPGYDAATRLLYEAVDVEPPAVPEHPTRQQTLEALAFLWKPFELFPFCSALDRAVHLAGLLTAAVRAILPTAPAFAYDAPVQGSGKTLLARCVGILATGADPSVWPHTAGRDDEEIRKRLFTVLRSGARSIVWDNVVGTFDSAALASALTSPTYSDRILGVSMASTVPMRAIVILTGNNLTLAGDLPRRVLISRIDPQTDKPFARAFDLDPAAHCQAHRQRMVASALILIRAMLTHGCASPGAGKMASFEDWDAWVRQAVIFADELWPGQFGDVMEVVKTNQAADPEQEALGSLLEAWGNKFGDKAVKVAEVLTAATETFGDDPLREALTDFVPSGRLSAKTIGKLLKYRNGRIVGGRRIEQRSKDENGIALWRVLSIPGV